MYKLHLRCGYQDMQMQMIDQVKGQDTKARYVVLLTEEDLSLSAILLSQVKFLFKLLPILVNSLESRKGQVESIV